MYNQIYKLDVTSMFYKFHIENLPFCLCLSESPKTLKSRRYSLKKKKKSVLVAVGPAVLMVPGLAIAHFFLRLPLRG